MQPASQNPLIQNTFLNNKYFDPSYLFNNGNAFFKQLFSFILNPQTIGFAKTVLALLAIFFLTVICYSFIRLLEIRKKEKAHLQHEIEEYAHNKIEYEKRLREDVGGSKNEHWSKTLEYLFSQHGSDWKLAIIEADAMLETLMEQLGFHGESLGDRLKMASQETFPQLSAAWEVHTIRNRIAHEGLAFELSQHEAKRVIALYEQIFHSYGFI
ncbi:MAG: hypothetical protein WAN61_01435 [Minisyncoccia bacterium]